jgi:hypothetical protein
MLREAQIMKRTIIITLGLLLCMAAVGLAQTEQKSTPASTLKAEAQVCTSVADRTPQGAATSFGTDVGQVYCWCKVTGGTGEESIKHIWSHSGKVVAEVPLTIKGSSWRTWSAKKIMPSLTGDWEVKVVDAAGNTLATATFTIGEAKK